MKKTIFGIAFAMVVAMVLGSCSGSGLDKIAADLDSISASLDSALDSVSVDTTVVDSVIADSVAE